MQLSTILFLLSIGVVAGRPSRNFFSNGPSAPDFGNPDSLLNLGWAGDGKDVLSSGLDSIVKKAGLPTALKQWFAQANSPFSSKVPSNAKNQSETVEDAVLLGNPEGGYFGPNGKLGDKEVDVAETVGDALRTLLGILMQNVFSPTINAISQNRASPVSAVAGQFNIPN